MQLSDNQIQYLFQFTEKKSVRWYDLQIELVDHLATRMEEEMALDKSLQFETALDKVYKEFGLFGFAKVVQEKQAQLHRAARKIWWQEIQAFFTWPKVILLALIVSVLWTLSTVVDPNILMTVFLVGYILASLALLINAFNYRKARRKLLLLQFGAGYMSSAIFFYEIFIFSTIDGVGPIEFCIYATLGILFKIASFKLYKKIKDTAMALYPAAFV